MVDIKTVHYWLIHASDICCYRILSGNVFWATGWSRKYGRRSISRGLNEGGHCLQIPDYVKE